MGEIARRLVHASGTAAPAVYLLGFVTWAQLGWLLVLGSAVALGLEILRLFVGLDWRIYERLTREYEQENLAGYALYMFAMTAVVLVFDPVVAIPAVLMLTIGDPISGYLSSGELREIKRTSSLAVMFAVCFVLAIPFTVLELANTVTALIAAGLGAFVATLADGVKPVLFTYVIDDNLTIPIGAAVTLWIALRYLPAGV